MLKVTVSPLTVAGSWYQCGDASPGVGPYFQYAVPAGSGCGYVMVKATVLPAVQPESVKSKSPCGKETFAGALPAGG
jgi:hypothetical protein